MNNERASEFTIINKSASNRFFLLKNLSFNNSLKTVFSIKCHSFCRPIKLLRYFFKPKGKRKDEAMLEREASLQEKLTKQSHSRKYDMDSENGENY